MWKIKCYHLITTTRVTLTKWKLTLHYYVDDSSSSSGQMFSLININKLSVLTIHLPTSMFVTPNLVAYSILGKWLMFVLD